MDTSLITAILQRVKAHYDTDRARIVIHEDESWEVYVGREVDDVLPVYTDGGLDRLPIYLSSLKNLTESHPKSSD